jgi:hypothetical protein
MNRHDVARRDAQLIQLFAVRTLVEDLSAVPQRRRSGIFMLE